MNAPKDPEMVFITAVITVFFIVFMSVIILNKNNCFLSGTGFVEKSLSLPVLLTLHPAPPVYPPTLTPDTGEKSEIQTIN